MQPQQDQNSGPLSQYDFIVAPPKPPRHGLVPGISGQDPLVQRIALVAGIGLGVIFIAFLAFSIFGHKGNGITDSLLVIAQEQTEMTHLSQGSSGHAQNSVTKNFAQSCFLTMSSGSQQIVALLAQNGKKVSPKTLALTELPAIDQQLTLAVAASDYDVTYMQIMQSQLKTYEASLKSAYTLTTNPTVRQLLNDDYKDAGILAEALNQQAQ